jgi:GDP-L-fucose synthase
MTKTAFITGVTGQDGAYLAEPVHRTVGYAGRIVCDAGKPDGTPRKLMDVSRLSAAGWRARTSLAEGLAQACRDFQALEAA